MGEKDANFTNVITVTADEWEKLSSYSKPYSELHREYPEEHLLYKVKKESKPNDEKTKLPVKNTNSKKVNEATKKKESPEAMIERLKEELEDALEDNEGYEKECKSLERRISELESRPTSKKFNKLKKKLEASLQDRKEDKERIANLDNQVIRLFDINKESTDSNKNLREEIKIMKIKLEVSESMITRLLNKDK
jgi:chromosome segregation ATPase